MSDKDLTYQVGWVGKDYVTIHKDTLEELYVKNEKLQELVAFIDELNDVLIEELFDAVDRHQRSKKMEEILKAHFADESFQKRFLKALEQYNNEMILKVIPVHGDDGTLVNIVWSWGPKE